MCMYMFVSDSYRKCPKYIKGGSNRGGAPTGVRMFIQDLKKHAHVYSPLLPSCMVVSGSICTGVQK